MTRWRIAALGVLSLIALQIGIWAQFAPSSFYRSFPGAGRHWISVDGPYNEHLIRDVGGLHLALAVLTIAALIVNGQARALLARITGIAWLAFSVPHAIYHAAHTEQLAGSSDKVSIVAFLAIFCLLAAALAAFPERRSQPVSQPGESREVSPRARQGSPETT